MLLCIRRRGVPLAVALLNTSNPSLSAMDMLSRLSHDSDVEVGQNAVLALGAPPWDLAAGLDRVAFLRMSTLSVLLQSSYRCGRP